MNHFNPLKNPGVCLVLGLGVFWLASWGIFRLMPEIQFDGLPLITWSQMTLGILMFIAMVGLSLFAIFHFGGPQALLEKAVTVNPHFLGIHPQMSFASCMGFSLATIIVVLSFPHVVMDALCHPIARGIAVAGILSAIMSTTSALLLTTGAEFSNNIYRRFIRPDASDAQTIRAGQILMFMVGIVTMLLSLRQDKSIGKLAGILIGGIGSTFVVSLVAGIWWRRANQTGCLASMIGGFVSYGAAYFCFKMPEFSWTLVSLPVAILCMIAGSLLSAQPSEQSGQLLEEIHRE